MTPPDIRATDAPRPAFTVRALVLDLDGTCISRGTLLHPRTRDAVRAAAQRVPVVVATGRMYVSALPWARALGVREPLVCYQGAVVRSVPEGAGGGGPVLLYEPLTGDAATRAIRIARANDWHVHAYENERLLAEHERPELQLYTEVAGVDATIVPDLEPFVREGTPKVVCVIDEPAEVRRCMAVMDAELDGRARVTQSREPYVEIISPRVSKASACALVCWRHGASLNEVVAIGDAPNDIELLDAAGFAVAVDAGRYPQVLEHVDATCAPPTEAGVADALEALGIV